MNDYEVYIETLSRCKSIDDIKKSISETHEEYQKSYDEVYTDTIIKLEKILENKVKKMSQISSFWHQGVVKQEIFDWASNYLGDKLEINRQIEKYSIEKKKYEIYNISELLKQRSEDKSNFIVKGLIPKGCLFIVAAAPKIGKSLFVSNLGLSVARGVNFLNRITEKGKVLYIQNEEQINKQTIDRVYYNGLQMLEVENNEEYKNLIESEQLLISKNLDIVEEQEVIKDIIKEKNISLLLVDSLGASLRKSGLDEYSKELTPALYKLQSICHELNCTCIIVHHSTKMDSSTDKKSMLDGVAGSSSLMRANDGIFRLFQDKNDEKIINFKTIPRDGTPVSLNIKLIEDEACYWNFHVEKETTLTLDAIKLQNQILRLLLEKYALWRDSLDIPLEEVNLKDKPIYGLTLKELQDITELPKHVLVRRLNDMKQTEGITFTPSVQSRSHIYHIQKDGESWMKVYLEIEEKQIKEELERKKAEEEYKKKLKSYKEELLNFIDNADHDSFLAFNKNLSKEDRSNLNNLLTDKDKMHIAYVKDIKPKFNKGEILKDINKNSVEIIDIKYERNVAENNIKGYYKYYINSDYNTFLTEEELTHENNSEGNNF